MNEIILKVENLSHRYSTQWVVRDINMQISNRGVYGLLGENGAGKSTIMNIMCGVMKPSEGSIFVEEVDMKENPVRAKRHIGFLPQQPPLYTDLTVEEYLVYCAQMRMIPRREVGAAVDRALAKCQIEHFRKRLIRNLSGGYQQRVGIAHAIIHEPDLLVLDEPTNGLDPNQIIEIRHLIKEIARERAVILSTHMLSEVQAACDYIYMINDGGIVFSGSIAEFDNYSTPDSIIAGFIRLPDPDELSSIPDVKEIELIGANKYRLTFDDATGALSNVMRIAVDRRWAMEEVRLEKSSLDMVFAELSKKEKNK